MKLLRLGETGSEKPALIDNENKYRDLSSIIEDLNPDSLNFETLEKIKSIDEIFTIFNESFYAYKSR